MHYRFYIVDRLGSFVDVADAHCANDDEARQEAQARLGGAPGIQVWQQARFVGSIDGRLAA